MNPFDLDIFTDGLAIGFVMWVICSLLNRTWLFLKTITGS